MVVKKGASKAANKSRYTRRKKFKKIPEARIYVNARKNNTLLTLTDAFGQPVTGTISAGTCGFKNCKKSTPHASQVAIKQIVQIACNDFQVNSLDIIIKGHGIGRDMVHWFEQNNKALIKSISDRTCMPHGGCRMPSARKV